MKQLTGPSKMGLPVRLESSSSLDDLVSTLDAWMLIIRYTAAFKGDFI